MGACTVPFGTCFHESGVVTLASGGSKHLADVELGDSIQTVTDADALNQSIVSFAFSEVILLMHQPHNSISANFVRLMTASGKTITMTPNHLLPT